MQKALQLTIAAACVLTSFQAMADRGMSMKGNTHGTKDTYYATAEGMISGIVSSVTITNTGDETLNPGDADYSLTLYQYNYSTPAKDIVTYPIPQALEPGESATISVPWPAFPLSDIIAAGDENKASWRNRYDMRENVSNSTVITTPWLEFYPYKVSFIITGESSGTAYTTPYNFGYVEGATTQKFRIRNTGAADLNITSIDTPTGFSVTPTAPFTMNGLAADEPETYKEINVTFDPEVSGAYTGQITFNAEGADPVSLTVSGAMIGAEDFFEDFELPSGASEETAVPEGWLLGDKWRYAWVNTSNNDKYMLDHTSADDAYYSFAITPRLDFGEGGALMFQTRKKSNYSKLEVMISPDRANWTPLALYTPNGTEEGATKFPTLTSTLGDYSLTIPAGQWYVGFKGMYTSINNVFGGKPSPVEHDIYAVSQEAPVKMVVNHPSTIKAIFRNLNSTAEPAGSYTVELIVNGEVAATLAAPEWEGGADLTFTASYTPHAPGEVVMSMRVTVAGQSINSESITVPVEAESADSDLIVGTNNTTNNYVPAQLNYENATSQFILPASYLAQYGLTPGAKITSLTFMGKPSKNIELHKKMKFWMLNEPSQTTMAIADVRDLTDVTPVYANESVNIEMVANDENFTVTIPLSEPFIYDGQGIFMSWETLEIENGQWGSANWQTCTEVKDATVYKYDDSDTSFPTKSWSGYTTGVPVIKFSVFEQAATLSGTVTGAGAPITDTDVTLSAGEVIYTTTTDSEGHYSVEVFQADLDYTLTIDHPQFPTYTTEVNLGGESQVLDIELPEFSQERDFELTINVTDNAGCQYDGVAVKLVSDRFSLEYDASETTLDANGSVTLAVYGGAHTATLAMPGMKPASVSFFVKKATTVEIALEEDVIAPYSLSATVDHDIVTGSNSLLLDWNGEQPVFTDDFESYAPFTITPLPWTGIDGDNLAPANLEGEYDNKGMPNYGQIINPTAVDPAWNLDNFYTLKPRSGKQYLGFITPADNGKVLNDWMISPAVELTDNNVVRFYAKGSDRVNARFTVGITEVENPEASDFTVISEGNTIDCSFADWTKVEIPLDSYAGKTVKIGIHCISESGSFLSMIDDFFVGRPAAGAALAAKSKRVVKSAANPNEHFEIYLDGNKVAETTDYNYTIADIAEGEHTVGVKALYVNSESQLTETTVNIDNSIYAKVNVAVTTNNGELPAATALSLVSDNDSYELQVANGALTLAALPKGSYNVKATAADYDVFTSALTVDNETNLDIALVESLVKPFNLSAETEQDGTLFNVTLKWNQDLGFNDSFEDYDDFATGSFGGWTTQDYNTVASYPISLNGNIITFPGCSTPQAPTSVAPLVFNPFSTSPSMGEDYAVHAPDGIKTVAFFGPQMATADKWLISPVIKIGEGYQLKFLAKAYDVYPELLQICVSTTGTEKDDFELLDEVSPAPASWTEYSLDLDQYAGKEVNLAIRCVSQDAFLVQVDKVEVAPVAADQVVSTGKVLNYDVALNGALHGSTEATVYTLEGLAAGKHKLAVTANYASGTSAPGEYDLELIDTALDGVTSGADLAMGLEGAILVSTSAEKTVEIYTTSGVLVDSATVSGSHTFKVAPGVYVVRAGTSTFKVAAR